MGQSIEKQAKETKKQLLDKSERKREDRNNL